MLLKIIIVAAGVVVFTTREESLRASTSERLFSSVAISSLKTHAISNSKFEVLLKRE